MPRLTDFVMRLSSLEHGLLAVSLAAAPMLVCALQWAFDHWYVSAYIAKMRAESHSVALLACCIAFSLLGIVASLLCVMLGWLHFAVCVQAVHSGAMPRLPKAAMSNFVGPVFVGIVACYVHAMSWRNHLIDYKGIR